MFMVRSLQVCTEIEEQKKKRNTGPGKSQIMEGSPSLCYSNTQIRTKGNYRF